MAINYKDIKKRVTTDPFTTDELNMISKIEKYIDEEIIKEFDKTHTRRISILLPIANFEYDPISNKMTDFGCTRRKLMTKELNKRYKAAGWKIEYYLDDGLDGPNMSGQDYWILIGKDK